MMGPLTIPSIIIVFALCLQLVGLFFAVTADPYIDRSKRKVMLAVISLVTTLVVQNYIGYRLDTDGTHPYARTLVGIYGYSIRPVILVLFVYIIKIQRKLLVLWLLAAANAVIHLTAIFSGVCYYIDENNHFHRGPLGYTCHIISGILLAYLLILTYREYRTVRKREAVMPFLNALAITVSVIMDSIMGYREFPETFLTVAVVTGSVFYYIWLHLQFVREHEEDLRARQRIKIMMSQIQPHFLYNTLGTIKALCDTDPPLASKVTGRFAKYLRQNLESLDTDGMTTLDKEMEHTLIYADIEMVRFKNVRVETDIEDYGVRLPSLSIQPLVENAIRHGVRIREDGIVRISARKKPGYHEIVVEDNGKGFEVHSLTEMDETHVGIRNVRERIRQMCMGSLVVESTPGTGTKVTIRIPERIQESEA